MNEQIVILDFGSQYTQVIARRIRECKVYSIIIHYNTPAAEIAKMNPSGIILSGGPSSVYAKAAPLPDESIFDLGVPVLGICFGQQVLVRHLGGRGEPAPEREYGSARLDVAEAADPLLSEVPAQSTVWMSHGDRVESLPPRSSALAYTENSPVAALEISENIFGLQFHPEVNHTPLGSSILENFLFRTCDCQATWTPGNFVTEAIARVRA